MLDFDARNTRIGMPEIVEPDSGTNACLTSPSIDRPHASRYTADMKAAGTLTEADILTELIDPGRPTLSPQVARELLALKFNDDATSLIRELLQKNNAGTITPAEKLTLDNYLRVGEFLDLIQAKARVTLQQNGPTV